MIDAVKLAKAGARVLGGDAGGRPDLASGGGPRGELAQEALQAIIQELKDQLKSYDESE